MPYIKSDVVDLRTEKLRPMPRRLFRINRPYSGAMHEHRDRYWLTVSPQDLVYPLGIQVLEDQEETEKSD